MQKKVIILGASGYTGAEAVRLMLNHPRLNIIGLGGDRHAGKPIAELYPHLRVFDLPELQATNALPWGECEILVSCLPHGVTQEVLAAIDYDGLVVDLSADFRLNDPALYQEWYGLQHQVPEKMASAIYGLSEWARDELAAQKSDIIACPGCYPTSALLPLLPLVKAELVDAGSIVIDAKSGVTGAGRAVKEATLYSELADGMHAYGLGGTHRHTPEIEQQVSALAGNDIQVSFTPHLVPMNRGILTTIYVDMKNGVTVDALREAMKAAYKDAAFVHVLPDGQVPATRHVRGSNYAHTAVAGNRLEGKATLVCAIDNLCKGSSGQAVQNINLYHGWDEALGLDVVPLFP